MRPVLQPTVSFIVAAYEAEDTIERCVRSVLDQTVPELEVIVVDDGSTDRTRQVVVDLAERENDERLVLAPPSENRGPGEARNHGLRLARGPWVGFLDADDVLRPEFLDRMFAAARAEPPADVVASAHRLVQPDGTTRTRRQDTTETDLSGDEATARALEFGLTHYVWDKLFRRDVLGSAPFPVDIHRGEDLPVVLQAFLASDVVRVVDEALVHYHLSPTSLTWGRVAPLAESGRLARAVRATVRPLLHRPRLRRGVEFAESQIYLHAAHQAIVRLLAAEATDFCRETSQQIPWSAVLRSLRSRPVDGVAHLVLKVAPAIYRRLYRTYVRAAYSLGD